MRIISKDSSDKFVFTDGSEVEGFGAIRKMVADNCVKAFVNCVSWTNVDAYENDGKLEALAEKLNADSPRNLATAMTEAGGVLFHVSTDYVFGHENEEWMNNISSGDYEKYYEDMYKGI